MSKVLWKVIRGIPLRDRVLSAEKVLGEYVRAAHRVLVPVTLPYKAVWHYLINRARGNTPQYEAVRIALALAVAQQSTKAPAALPLHYPVVDPPEHLDTPHAGAPRARQRRHFNYPSDVLPQLIFAGVSSWLEMMPRTHSLLSVLKFGYRFEWGNRGNSNVLCIRDEMMRLGHPLTRRKYERLLYEGSESTPAVVDYWPMYEMLRRSDAEFMAEVARLKDAPKKMAA